MKRIRQILGKIAEYCETGPIKFGAAKREYEELFAVNGLSICSELEQYFLQCIPSKPFGWTVKFHSVESLTEEIEGSEPSIRLFPMGFIPFAEDGDGSPVCYSLFSGRILLVDFVDFVGPGEVERRASKTWPTLEQFFLRILRETESLADGT